MNFSPIQSFMAPMRPRDLSTTVAKSVSPLKNVDNPCVDDDDYALIKGHPENGIVVWYPQTHLVGVDIDSGQNKVHQDEIFSSQLSIYNDLMKMKAEHVYVEDCTPGYAALINNPNPGQRPEALPIAEAIQESLRLNHPLNQEQKFIFLNFGGACFYALMSQQTDTPATLHPTTLEEDKKIFSDILEGRSSTLGLSSIEHHIIFKYREKQMEKAIMETQPLRAGKPAYMTMGRAHQFTSNFSDSNSPALYRKKSG